MRQLTPAPIEEIVWHCFRQNYHLDYANAAVHTALVRFSPLTFRLAEYIWETFPSYRSDERLHEVWLDRGEYEEDTGR